MTGTSAAAPLQAVDLRLRGDPPGVTRLSRRALATVGLIAAAGIGGALVYALRPSVPAEPRELHDTGIRPSTEGLAGAPKDYSQIPRLGPPLPGDLGRPILSAQQRGVEVTPPPIGAPPASASPARDAHPAARDRAREERDAARTSKMFVGSEAAAPSSPAAAAQPPATASATPQPAPLSTSTGRGDHAAKRAFLRGGDAAPPESGFRIVSPGSPRTLQAGSIIPAALITGIRSDLPGMITAQVTQNVFDSMTGRRLLIPQGSRLIGEYDAQISIGQNRVLLAWTRLILPNGSSVLLDRLPGADVAGFAGVQDEVNQHWGGVLRAALISTLLSIGTEVGNASDDDLVRAIRQGGAESIGRSGQDLVRRQMGMQPTLTIRPGFQLRVIVTRDLVLDPQGAPT